MEISNFVLAIVRFCKAKIHSAMFHEQIRIFIEIEVRLLYADVLEVEKRVEVMLRFTVVDRRLSSIYVF
ncbi:MAG: hypothetical protein CL607_04325 [Anaerolineaceae bacterium]|nr:hypothetical protein [Anaerolineaceae bacterium]